MLEILMNSYILRFGPGLVLASLVAAALADAPKPTQDDAKAKIEGQILAKAQAKCAEKGQVALGQHVNGTFMVKCVSPDDPDYKAQQSAQPAH
jgi:hypothetical protein